MKKQEDPMKGKGILDVHNGLVNSPGDLQTKEGNTIFKIIYVWLKNSFLSVFRIKKIIR